MDGTYNITVEDFENYFVGEQRILVHNCKVLQTGSRTISKRTAKHFGRPRREVGRAVEELKKYNGLRNDNHATIKSNGDYVVDGKVVDNINNYFE